MLGSLDGITVMTTAAMAMLTVAAAVWRRLPPLSFIAFVFLTALLAYFAFLGNIVYWYEIQQRKPSAEDYDYSCEQRIPKSDQWNGNCVDARLKDVKPPLWVAYDEVARFARQWLMVK